RDKGLTSRASAVTPHFRSWYLAFGPRCILSCSVSILIPRGILPKPDNRTSGSPMYDPQMLEPERVRPEMIHHEKHEQQRWDQAPEKARAFVLQVHEEHHGYARLDECKNKQEQEQSIARQMPVGQEDLNSYDAQQTDPDCQIRFHSQSISWLRGGHLASQCPSPGVPISRS